jgi:hypothetical protein
LFVDDKVYAGSDENANNRNDEGGILKLGNTNLISWLIRRIYLNIIAEAEQAAFELVPPGWGEHNWVRDGHVF